MKFFRTAFAAVIALCAHPALALPKLAALPADATPATLDARQVTAGGTINLALPGQAVVVQGVTQSPAPGLFSLAARSSDRGARLYAFVAEGRLRAADVYAGAHHWRLVEALGATYWVAAGTTVKRMPLPDPEPHAAAGPRSAGTAATAAPGADGRYEVRLLALYTAAAAERIGGEAAVTIEAQRLTALTNAIYANNAVPVRLALTDVRAYGDSDESVDFQANLDSIRGSRKVKTIRDVTQSDLVVLFRAQDTTGMCGLASLFDPGDHSDPPQNVDPERDAFTVVALPDDVNDSGCIDNVLAHEIGHLLSAGHDWASVAGTDGVYWKPYAHALACLDSGQEKYFSLMWGIGIGSGGGRGDVITNPNAPLGNLPCGSAGIDGVEASQADNVRAMSEAAPYVAAYRTREGGGDKSLPVPGAGALSSGFGVLAVGLLALRRSRR